MSLHTPIRPQWKCAICAAEWPCHTRRRQLLAQFDGSPASLALVLARHLVQACEDLPTTASGLLHHRFLGWLNAASAPPRTPPPRRPLQPFPDTHLPNAASIGYSTRRPAPAPRRGARRLLAALKIG
ncbi:hypothetical protein Cs7R123_29770 [Catellatospora sp. TT07R-123]|nr:hypothetical protein Cs7R123_29770 [Catellatospora sp. TT07R-123]